MSRTLRSALVWLALPAAPALAGMPMLHLSDLAELRFQAISFFLLALVLSALGVRALWNRLAADFPRLPRLGVRQAFAVIVLWGLAFHLVLTMISGARELMTPGAWTPEGSTYQLTRKEALEARDEHTRRERLEALRGALWAYAEAHGGSFPDSEWDPAVDQDLWPSTDPTSARFVYLGGQAADQGHTPLAWEPGVFGAERLVLFTDGEIAREPVAAILAALPGAAP